MDDIKIVFKPILNPALLCAGCCCQIDLGPHGYVYGPKLKVTEEPPPV